MLKRVLRQAPTPPARSRAPAALDAWWLWLSAMPRAGRIGPALPALPALGLAPGALRGSRP